MIAPSASSHGALCRAKREAVISDERGRSSFAELQADLDKHGSERAVLYAFDPLFLDGEAL